MTDRPIRLAPPIYGPQPPGGPPAFLLARREPAGLLGPGRSVPPPALGPGAPAPRLLGPGSWLEPTAPRLEPGTPRATPRPARRPPARLLTVLLALASAGAGFLAGSPHGSEPAPARSAAGGSPSPSPLVRVASAGLGDDVSAVARAALPSVVTIVVSGSRAAADPFGGAATPYRSVGSGVVVGAGLVLTNRHVVVDAASSVTVVDQAGARHQASVYGVDSLTDLAIVRVAGAVLPVARLGDSDSLAPGQTVVAIGSPLGTYTGSVTAGIVSALGRSITAADGFGGSEALNGLIQTDAAINEGNSGGPLLDASGAVVGLNTAVNQGAQGIGFAIPIAFARPLIEQAAAGQPLARAYLGINWSVLPPDPLADPPAASLPPVAGAYLGAAPDGTVVMPGSPAALAGLAEGDVITAIDGVALGRARTIDTVLATHKPGDRVTLSLWRAGATSRIEVVLATRPPRTA